MNIDFLGWNNKLTDAIADKLLTEGNSWDDLLLIVPTEEAAKRLRIALVQRSKTKAILPPQIQTSAHLLNAVVNAEPYMDMALRVAWARVIGRVKEPNALIRILPEDRSFTWCMQMANLCLQARRTLHENLKSFNDVLDFPNLPSHEVERWELLVEWEKEARMILAEAGVKDIQDEELAWAHHPTLSPEISRIIFAGEPDPLPLLVQGLNRLASSGAIELSAWVHAPEGFKVDEWGRPCESAELELIDIPDQALELVSGGSEMVDRIITWFREASLTNTQCSIGCCDSSFANVLSSGIEEAGWRVYRAGGYETKRTGIVRLIKQLELALASPDEWSAFEPLCRSTLLAELLGLSDHVFKVTQILDTFDRDHIPNKTSFAFKFFKDSSAKEKATLVVHHMTTIQNWLETWQSGSVGAATLALASNLRSAGWVGKFQDKILKHLEAVGQQLVELESSSLSLKPTELLAILSEALSKVMVYTDRDDSDIMMQGWFDLSFERADYIALTGMHEGCVPDTKVEDPFLPDSLKKGLRLSDRAMRIRRDAFLLKGLIESRKNVGGIRIYVAKTQPNGNPCTPSSLLMKCREDQLADRALALFKQLPETDKKYPRSEGNRPLTPPTQVNPWKKEIEEQGRTELSPSLFNEFLRCPRRMWLKKVCKMNEQEWLCELDDAKLGTHIHACAERLGPQGDLQNVYDKEQLIAELQNGLKEDFEKNYGPRLTLPLMLQLDDLTQRLRTLVEFHLKEIIEPEGAEVPEESEKDNEWGKWDVIATEKEIRWTPWDDLPIDIVMRVDRIERHRYDKTKLRVIDFKTSKKGKKPEEAHLEKVTAKQEKLLPRLFPYLPLVEKREEGKDTVNYFRWKNLQLPLYVLAVGEVLAREYNIDKKKLQAAYFNVPIAQDNRGILKWDIGEDVLQSALQCARGIAEKLLHSDGSDLHWAEEFGGKVFPNDPFTHLAPADVTALFQQSTQGDQQ